MRVSDIIQEPKTSLDKLTNMMPTQNSDWLKEHDKQMRADVIKPIMRGIDDFRTLERKMCKYFNEVDMHKEKDDLERLALDIVCHGMQTIGCLIQELDLINYQAEERSRIMSYWDNISKIEAKQTAKGIKEYGQTLEQNQAPSVLERIDYIEEELVDALKYLEWLKEGLKNEQQSAFSKDSEANH